MYKPPPEYKPPSQPQEKFVKKALWPKISPGAYYRILWYTTREELDQYEM